VARWPGAKVSWARRLTILAWDALKASHGMTVEEATEKFPAQAGISRYGTPEEVADLMAFLVSRAAKWLTGTSVRIDGGEIKGI
jgi:3-oxoacyl-[acyl-carrier protein] reductase